MIENDLFVGQQILLAILDFYFSILRLFRVEKEQRTKYLVHTVSRSLQVLKHNS